MTFGTFKKLFGVQRAHEMMRKKRLVKMKNASDAGSDVIRSAKEAAEGIGFKEVKSVPEAIKRKTQNMPV